MPDLPLKNTKHLVEYKEWIVLKEDEMLESFDVKSLFTNIPVSEAIEICERRLRMDKTLPKRTSMDVDTNMLLDQFCLNNTSFLYGGQPCWPPATCRFSARRSFHHHGKGNGKQSFEKKQKKVKLVRISHRSENDENAIDCEIACDCVKCANVVLVLRKGIFARTHTATHKPASAQRLKVKRGVKSKKRRSGQSVTASDFGSNSPRFESGRGRCVESLDKALYSHCPKEKPSH